MDTVFIRGLRLDMVVGIYDWERDRRQPLVLDLDLHPAPGAALSDGASRAAFDYAQVVQAVRAFVAQRDDGLLETLAEALCAHLVAHFGVHSVRLRIDKPQAALLLGCAQVGIDIVRPRRD